MSDLITTVYPTAGMESKTVYTVQTALYTTISNEKSVSDFFTVTDKNVNTVSSYRKRNGIDFTCKTSNIKARIALLDTAGTTATNIPLIDLQGYSSTDTSGGGDNGKFTEYYSPAPSDAIASDIPVRFATGINGTGAMWLDDYSCGCVLVYGTHGGLDLVMSSAAADDVSFYIANTDASTAVSLPMPCNGDLIGTGNPYVGQPYFWNGINTGDIYTFDCGSGSIPYGEFWIGDKHFVSLYSNFALRLE